MEGEVTAIEPAVAAETPTEVVQPVEQTPVEPAQDKPAGFDQVEFTPEQKARVDRIYGNMKRYETVAKKVPELEQANEILVSQIRQLHESQGKIVNHLQISDFQDAEQHLKSERQAAWAAGNSSAYDDANDKLRDLSVKRALAEMQTQKPQAQQVQQQSLRPVNGEAVIDLAVQRGSVTPEEAGIYRTWMNESDESGNTKRPWISETDPRNIAAASEGRAVFNNPVYAHMTFAQKLQEIDRRMGVRMPQGQNVLPTGNLTAPRKNNNVKLTDYETKIAIKTKFGGPKAKSDADHVEAWKQAKIKSQQKGASR